MARSVGGPIQGPTMTVLPKSGYTPAVGDLVTWDLTGNMQVDKCVADENPIGQIIWVAEDATYMTMEQFCGGMVAELTYSSALTLNQKIEVGATANQIVTDNTNGVGKCIAKDSPTSGKALIYFE